MFFCLDPLNSKFYNNYGIFPQYILPQLIFRQLYSSFLETESIKKSNFNFQYTKIITLHQDILNHIAFFFLLIRTAIDKN